jgi:hypothetical protein
MIDGVSRNLLDAPSYDLNGGLLLSSLVPAISPLGE